MNKLSLTLSAVFALTLAVFVPQSAHGQSDPFSGLDPAVRQIGSAIDSGNGTSITTQLAQGEIIKTAFPGDGTPVARSVAVAEIPVRIVSNAGQSDTLGTGEYRLLAVWIPAGGATEILLMGSGIDSTGTRQTTAFAVEPREGSWKITAWGHVVDTNATLAQWADQGDLRRVEGDLAPRPPATGEAQVRAGASSDAWLFAGGALLTLAALLAGVEIRRRFG